MSKITHLTTEQMATFAARGFLRFDGVVPGDVNVQCLNDIGDASPELDTPLGHYANIMSSSVVPLVSPGTPLDKAYPEGSALDKLINVPEIAGAIDDLVGLDCVVDHHFLHITFPPGMQPGEATPLVSQAYHQDSTVDPRRAFDIQIFYFPHEVTPEMGGTRFVPGSQYRIVSEAAIARYQNVRGQQHVVCPAGTAMIFHMGLWHGGGLNRSDRLRYLFKIRLCPSRRQRWKPDPDYPGADGVQRPIFWTDAQPDANHLASILTKREPWFEADTERLEYINRTRFWRYLTGDDDFDADYWLSRIENEYG